MEDLFLFCENPECVCEDLCCQECDKKDNCDDVCESYKFKQKCYNDDSFLGEHLESLALHYDNWVMLVAAKRLKETGEQEG